MSKEIYKNRYELFTDEQKIFFNGFINLNQSGLVIDWDLDQTLEITEDPVKAAIDLRFGTNYSDRRVNSWRSVAEWLTKDKILNAEDADKYESSLWINNLTLYAGRPNEYLRALSYVAYLRNIPQTVTTVRALGLRQMTYKWLDENFWWIKSRDINFNVSATPGREFKIESIVAEHKKYPGLIHVDDDMKIMKILAGTSPSLGLIGITNSGDDVSSFSYSGNRVFLDREDLNGRIYYRPFESEMNQRIK